MRRSPRRRASKPLVMERFQWRESYSIERFDSGRYTVRHLSDGSLAGRFADEASLERWLDERDA